jgi:hypothetical protein
VVGVHWFLHFFGLDSASGPAYLAWSGSLSDLGELTLVGAFIAVWRAHTCHTHWWCWRRPLFTLPGSPFRTCHWHHPDDQMTPRQALEAANAASDGE